MAAFGFSDDDYSDDDAIRVWGDNWPTFSVFERLSTQWRTGMSGPTGLDYGVIPDVLRFSGVPETDWPDLFAGIRIMEDAALGVMHESKK